MHAQKYPKWGLHPVSLSPVPGRLFWQTLNESVWLVQKTLRTGDLLFPDKLRDKLADLVEWKNITVQGYGHEPVSVDEMYAWLEKYAFPWREYLCNTTEYLSAQADAGKSILFEAQLGALRDIDFGIYPYTSSSSTIAAYAPIGAGIPAKRLDSVVGIMKAYSSCVGHP